MVMRGKVRRNRVIEDKGTIMRKTDNTNRHPRVGTRKMINDMLEQRQRMLVLLWDLSKIKPAQTDEHSRETLDEFLSILVDYIAAGHFGLYGRIAAGNERRTPVTETAGQIYPRIADSTALSVDFAERYERANEQTLSTRLTSDLSELGEALSTRIELEDRLIRAMLGEDELAA